MLHHKQKKAVRLLCQVPEERVAAEVGVLVKTLRRWMGNREFAEALAAQIREGRDSAARICSQGYAHAAAKLHEVVAGETGASAKLDVKTLVDILKGGGILKDTSDAGNDNPGFDASLSQVAARNGETYDPSGS
ncbi:MAG: hypothetical protein Q7T82_18235 [Armatimonadota bacterium]|nr:hypothetical protein [Armatimonadota bacterium]